MKAKTYRLDEYKIIQFDTGQLMWEAHFGFGQFQTGRCFAKGSILFIGPAENRENGFLKGEFLDDLKRYPQWIGTKYFCIGFDIKHCKNGKRLTIKELMWWTLCHSSGEGVKIHRDASRNFSNSAATEKVKENVEYRLQQDEIIVRTDGQIVSRTFTRSNFVKSGNCFILENILFIGLQQNEPFALNKRQFIVKLCQLPRWDRTNFFCKRFSLNACYPDSMLQGEWKRLQRWESVTKNGARNDCVTNSEPDISNGPYMEVFSASLSTNFGSSAKPVQGQSKRGQFSRFIRSNILNNIAIFRELSIIGLKKTIRMVALIYSLIASFFALLIGVFKKQYGRWNGKNK